MYIWQLVFHHFFEVYQRVFRFQVSFRFLDFAIFRHHPTQRNAMVSWQEAPPLWIPPSSIDLEDSLWFFPPLFWRMPKYNIIHLYISHGFFDGFPIQTFDFSDSLSFSNGFSHWNLNVWWHRWQVPSLEQWSCYLAGTRGRPSAIARKEGGFLLWLMRL